MTGAEQMTDQHHGVLLFDFTNGVTRWITQEEADALMREQHERGVRLTCGDTTPPLARHDILREALLSIAANAEAWHGDNDARSRALAVIARTARTALADDANSQAEPVEYRPVSDGSDEVGVA